MIVGVGVDVCEVERIRRAMTRASGARFSARVFTDGERAACETERGAVRWESYAARFAAKEAVMKALGTGWSEGVAFADVEVVREERQAPAVRLHGEAARVARRRGIARWHVSLSHTAGLAVAVVVAEGRATRLTALARGAAGGSARPRPTRRRRSR